MTKSTHEAETPHERLLLVHHHPGRLRVRARAFQVSGPRAEEVREATLAIAGVTRFEHRVRTGSLLIEYEPRLVEPDTILAAIARAAGIESCTEGALSLSRAPALLAVEAVQELNAIAAELTGHRADLRSLVPAGLAALSAYTFVTSKEPKLPRWDNLLWWSYSVFVAHHGEEIGIAAEGRRRRSLEVQTPELTSDPVPAKS